MKTALVFLGLVAAVYGQTTSGVTTCNNNAPTPINTFVVGCTTAPCGLPQLSTAVIELVFQAPRLVRRLQARALAYIGFLPVPYDLEDQTDACRGLTNSYCPVLPGEVLTYTLNMFIESFFPVGIAPNLEFSILDGDTGDVLLCVRFGIRVDSPLGGRAANATDLPTLT